MMPNSFTIPRSLNFHSMVALMVQVLLLKTNKFHLLVSAFNFTVEKNLVFRLINSHGLREGLVQIKRRTKSSITIAMTLITKATLR